MAVEQVTKQNFKEVVLDAQEMVLVDFYADWCGPCKMLAPFVRQIAEEHPEIKVCKVNVDDEADLALEYKVKMIPTLVVFRNGEVLNQLVGVQSKEEIEDMLK